MTKNELLKKVTLTEDLGRELTSEGESIHAIYKPGDGNTYKIIVSFNKKDVYTKDSLVNFLYVNVGRFHGMAKFNLKGIFDDKRINELNVQLMIEDAEMITMLGILLTDLSKTAAKNSLALNTKVESFKEYIKKQRKVQKESKLRAESGLSESDNQTVDEIIDIIVGVKKLEEEIIDDVVEEIDSGTPKYAKLYLSFSQLKKGEKVFLYTDESKLKDFLTKEGLELIYHKDVQLLDPVEIIGDFNSEGKQEDVLVSKFTLLNGKKVTIIVTEEMREKNNLMKATIIVNQLLIRRYKVLEEDLETVYSTAVKTAGSLNGLTVLI